MIDAMVLLGYAALTATLAATWLRAGSWTQRSPRLGIGAWLALISNVVAAVVLAGLSFSLGLPHVSTDLAALVDTCATTLRHAYSTPGGTLGSLVGVVVLVALTARLAWSVSHSLIADRRQRRDTIDTLDLLGRRDVLLDVLVLEHPTPYAFCVPGRNHRIVLTSAALSTLDRDELRAVVAHERAHLRGRHHLPLAIARALALAFPFVPAFREANAQIALLVELLADDAARGRVGATSLTRALTVLTRSPAPSAALAASALDVEDRLTRLLSPTKPLRGAGLALAVASIGLSIGAPFAILALPAVSAITEGLCLIG